jgi:hypothetical protein
MPLHSGEFSENPLKKAPLHVESQNNIVPKLPHDKEPQMTPARSAPDLKHS